MHIETMSSEMVVTCTEEEDRWKAIPKVELHAHFFGSISKETLLYLQEKKKLQLTQNERNSTLNQEISDTQPDPFRILSLTRTPHAHKQPPYSSSIEEDEDEEEEKREEEREWKHMNARVASPPATAATAATTSARTNSPAASAAAAAVVTASTLCTPPPATGGAAATPPTASCLSNISTTKAAPAGRTAVLFMPSATAPAAAAATTAATAAPAPPAAAGTTGPAQAPPPAEAPAGATAAPAEAAAAAAADTAPGAGAAAPVAAATAASVMPFACKRGEAPAAAGGRGGGGNLASGAPASECVVAPAAATSAPPAVASEGKIVLPPPPRSTGAAVVATSASAPATMTSPQRTLASSTCSNVAPATAAAAISEARVLIPECGVGPAAPVAAVAATPPSCASNQTTVVVATEAPTVLGSECNQATVVGAAEAPVITSGCKQRTVEAPTAPVKVSSGCNRQTTIVAEAPVTMSGCPPPPSPPPPSAPPSRPPVCSSAAPPPSPPPLPAVVVGGGPASEETVPRSIGKAEANTLDIQQTSGASSYQCQWYSNANSCLSSNSRSNCGGVREGLDDAFDYFAATYKLIRTQEEIRYALRQVLHDFYNENVVYLELRTTLKEIKEENIDAMVYVSLLVEELEQAKKTLSPLFTVRLIISINRALLLDEQCTRAEVEKAFSAAARHPRWVVGIDIAGDPRKGDIRFALEMLQQEINHQDGRFFKKLKWTVHTAEITDVQRMRLLNENVVTEVCPTSNMCTLHIRDLRDHHSKFFFEQKGGHRSKNRGVCVCTDDSGLFETSLTRELRLVAEAYSLTIEEVLQLQREALAAAFCSEEDKERLRLQYFSGSCRGAL